MDNLLNVNPGLMIWTFINFAILLFLIIKFGGKAIVKGLQAREEHIDGQIKAAEEANEKAQKLFAESEAKITSARQEMAEIIAKGKDQAEIQLRKATEEADAIRRKKIEESAREIERQKITALNQIRNEVAGLVVEATEKILQEKIDSTKDYELINKYIDNIQHN